MKETTLGVKGMTCNHCVMAISEGVGSIDGVSEVDVSLEEGTVTVFHSEEIDPDRIKEKIGELGYDIG